MPKRARDPTRGVPDMGRNSRHYRPSSLEKLELFYAQIQEVQEDSNIELPKHCEIKKLINGEGYFVWTDDCTRELEALENATGVHFVTIIGSEDEEEEEPPYTCEGPCYCNWQFCEVQ